MVELSLVPLVGMAVSRGVFRGACGLQKTLGSLSADGWGCVPTMLVVCPETSQHWSLLAVGWGQVLVSRWLPPGELTSVSTPTYLLHQCLCPHSEPQLPPASLEIFQDQQVGLAQASVKSLLSPWVPVCMRPSVCPSRVEFMFCPVLWSSCNEALLVFKAKCSGRPLPMPDPQTGEPDVGLRTFIPVGEPLRYSYFLVSGSPTQQVRDLIVS